MFRLYDVIMSDLLPIISVFFSTLSLSMEKYQLLKQVILVTVVFFFKRKKSKCFVLARNHVLLIANFDVEVPPALKF